jgi:hypothetical protein
MDFLISKKQRGFIILIMISVFFSLSVTAQQSNSKRPSHNQHTGGIGTYTLTASPGICVSRPGKSQCEMEMALIWESPEAGNFCLIEQSKDKELVCWENTSSGVYTFYLKAEKHQQYHLTKKDNVSILASTRVKVLSYVEQRLRAKRRHGFWRIF